jgi:hypothetical protein
MPAVEALTGRDVRRSPELWSPYSEVVRAVVASVGDVPTVLFGVCTPDELAGWPDAHWVLLDCEDGERRRRLASWTLQETDAAVTDAGQSGASACPWSIRHAGRSTTSSRNSPD